MSKRNITFQLLAGAILLALAVPVRLATKFRNERVEAVEFAEEFHIYGWKIRLDSFKSIEQLKVELYHTSNNSETPRLLLATLSSQKPDLLHDKQLIINIFIQSDEIRLRVGKNQINAPLPFRLPEDNVVPYNLGGVGQLISPSSFLLMKYPGGSITATLTES